jgi:hypothetical protein
MKMRKRALACSLVFVIAGLVAAKSARAGYKIPYAPVAVGSTYAYGILGDARNGGDGNQDIGCSVYTTSTGYLNVFCIAQITGASFSCSTSNPAFAAVAESMSGNDYLYFAAASNGGTCTGIQVGHSSEYRPLTP